MEQDELKRKLLGLWERTTHHSKDLLSNLFEYYFDYDLIDYKEIDGKIVGALCGIPYTFGYGSKRLFGLYIIVLSSEEGYSKKGILSQLLNDFNKRAEENYDFTFLVPPTELMADYYGTNGYFSSFFILEERFTSLHDFKNDYFISLTDSDDRIKEMKKSLFNNITVVDNKLNKKFPSQLIIDFIRDIEGKSTSSVNLCHTAKDIEYLLHENTISEFGCFVSYDKENNITGVLFTKKDDLKRIKVVAEFVSDTCSYFSILDFIKHQYQDYSLSINTSDPKLQSHSIIQQIYASANPEGGDLDNTFSVIEIPFNMNKLLQPLGMVKLLNLERIIKYLAETRSDIEFKLNIRDYKNSDEEKKVYIVKNGKCQIASLNKLVKDNSILHLTIKEVSELLLRKNDSSNLIMEAFGIPRLNLQMRLLPV